MKYIFVLISSILLLASTGCAIEKDTTMQNTLTLSGTWQVEDIDQGGVIDRSHITLQFDEDGRISGSTGCNRYFGSVDTANQRFIVAGVGSTRMACAPALMQQEQRFLQALNDAKHYKFEDNTWLRIYDAADTPRLKLIQLKANSE